ncbi:MAG TPA: SusC/RagA family TonB-linked outer membrane protein [Gemmatimonadales bacterium]|nr:SusC/RagA family TonB-linked outer membrane protein [Gemmatimonadales bacterium]
MTFNHIRRQVRGAALGFAFLLGGAPLAAQGVVTGRVTDAATKQPLQQAQVTLVGATTRVLTNADGQYRLPNVPNGTAQIRVAFIGYKSMTQSVDVSGGSATLDFALTSAPVGLDAVTVTATGNEAKREQGTATPQIDMTKVAQTAPITDMANALNSRVPGVVVQEAGGTTGSGTRIRIRGSNSVSLSNDPVILVDGIRVDGTASSNSVGVGGQVPSRINDYNADDLESIQVAEGPSAGVLYGTDAANGVIAMQTKKGHPGPTEWHVSTEGGLSNDIGNYPTNYLGVTSGGTSCRLTQMAEGKCTIASVRTLNPLVQFSPFRQGNLSNIGVSAEGGNEQTTYYVSSHYNFENGVYAVDYQKQVFLRGNLHQQASSNLVFDVSTGYVNSRLRLPQNDNNTFGVLSSGFLGTTNAAVNDGYGFLTPQQSFSVQAYQYIDHFTGSFQAKYTPYSWLAVNAVLGNDFVSRQDQNTDVPGLIPQSFSNNAFIGSRNSNPFQIYNWTANFYGSGSFLVAPNVSSVTSAGIQYVRTALHGVTASVLGLTAGSGSLAGGVIPTVSEQTSQSATVGKFAEERVGINNRLFMSAAARSDNNSAFGRSFGNVFYPKFDASWVMSEEPFFPQISWLNSLRVRGAIGKSGLHPNPTDALQFDNPVPVDIQGSDVTGITVGNLGNSTLKPETDNEIEGGFDATLLDQRVNLTVTGYSKASHDALVSVPLPLSCGLCSINQVQNLGEIDNKGIEISLFTNVIRSNNLSVDLTVGAWGNRNRVATLGKTVPFIAFGLGGATQRFEPGYQAGAYFQRSYTFADANHDGIIDTNEVHLASTTTFQGNAFPDHGASLGADITFMQRWHLSGLFDGRFGNKLFNSTEQFRCGLSNCQGRNDPKASLADQAAAVANIKGSQAGYMQDANFVKLRELSLTYDAPDNWAHRVGAKAMSITVAGRNLITWTSYPGLDPELNEAGQSQFTTADFLTQPPIRYWTAKINFTF